MIYYISDLHFGHANAIKFDARPFADVEEMDRVMIERWNETVCDDDVVYIVGDFCYRSGRSAAWYLSQLKGQKHLVVGNHDCQQNMRCGWAIPQCARRQDGGFPSQRSRSLQKL